MANKQNNIPIGKQSIWRQSFYCLRIGSPREALQVLLSGIFKKYKLPWQY